MGSRKRAYVKKPFESLGQSWDTSANIYHSMQMCEAWKDLTAQQKVLYLACKDQLYAERKKPIEEDPLSFTLNQHKWMREYGLYTSSNQKGFYRDMRALVAHGFIVCVFSGRFTREKSVFRFSSAWRRWGQPGFTLEAGQPIGPGKSPATGEI